MSDEELELPDEFKLKKLRNLRMFKGKTDEEIFEFYRNRDPRSKKEKESDEKIDTNSPENPDDVYDRKFKAKLKLLQSEFGIDMNNANDAELLKNLVRTNIQLEIVNEQIIRLQRQDEIDTRALKNLGDYQKSLTTAQSEIQANLNITRKQRKEKQIDDVGMFITDLKKKAREFYDRKTVQIRCPKDGIELSRYWLNFPEDTRAVHFEVLCTKCGETVVYTV